MFGGLKEHKRDNRQDFSFVRSDLRRVEKNLKKHGKEARVMRAEANELIETRHRENQETTAALTRDVAQISLRVQRIIWTASIVVGLVVFFVKEVALPIAVHLAGLK